MPTEEVRAFVISAPVKGANDVIVTVGGKLPLNSDWATVDAAIESVIAKTAKK